MIAVISWMAGMLYLPRLFVYHAEARPGSQLSETFKIMERRLLRMIVNPAMILVWLTGLSLAFAGKFFEAGWLDAKFLLVLAMSGSAWLFCKDREGIRPGQKSAFGAVFYRKINEIPTILMIAIVVLVIVKPF